MRFTRERQCDDCGELDDGACACTHGVVYPQLGLKPQERAERSPQPIVLDRTEWPPAPIAVAAFTRPAPPAARTARGR